MADSPQNMDVKLEIQSDPAQFAAVRSQCGSLAQRIGFEETEATKINLALDEALANVVKHGYQWQADRPIYVSMKRISAEGRVGLQIVVEDEAEQVDPAAIKGRDLEDFKPGGLGVHLMKTVMDRVEHRHGAAGMQLEMVKFLADTVE